MDRRLVLGLGAAAAGAAFWPRGAEAAFEPRPDGWRHFEITTRVTLPAGESRAEAWVPIPAVDAPGWMRPGEIAWTSAGGTARRAVDETGHAPLVRASWEGGGGDRVLEVVARVATQSRASDLSERTGASLSDAERAHYTAATDLIPTDGIVRETAERIVLGAGGDQEKARRIYDWIVINTARDPETRGCGLGDVASMLMMGDLTGKCADLNALYVGLARAAGLPARDVYGLRVAPSDFGYKSLGAGSENVTKAQHCRAEVHLDGVGWVPVDPADVRKVMLEEPPGDLPLGDPKVVAAREALFGAWEGNWIAYNFAHDVVLPGSSNGPLEFLMYPQAEIDGQRLDPLAEEKFYEITAREVAA